MATEPKRIQRIIAPVGTIQNGQICIEPDNDVDLNYEALGWKTADGDTHKALAKDQHAKVSSIESSTSITKGGVEVFANGDQYIDLSTVLPAPSEQTGRIFWDIENDCPAYYDSHSGTLVQVSYEGLIQVKNNTGTTILNGKVVYGSGADGSKIEVSLANAKTYDRNQVLAVITHDILNGETGKAVNFGVVRDFDTSHLVAGERVFLDITDGNLTTTRPVFPAKPIIVGHCISSHPTAGTILVSISQDKYDYEFDGCVIEKQDYSVVVEGGNVYCDVALEGGGDLPVQINGDVKILDCTTGSGIGGWARVQLTAGTDTSPQRNFIYIELVGGVATLKSATSAPTGSYANVGSVSIFSAAKTLTDGAIMNRRTTDAVVHDGSGHIQHLNERIRAMGSAWAREGMTQTVAINTAPNPDTVDFSITSGKFWQLHKQISPALDFATNGAYVLNASGSGSLSMYQKVTDINDLNEFSDGTSFAVNNRVNFVFLLIGNKTQGECKLGVLLPDGSYSDNDSAYFDVDGSVPLVVPTEVWEVSIPLARIPLLYGPSTWSFINPAGKPNFVDLRGIGLNAGAGGAGGSGASTFAGLEDTEITTPSNGNIVAYDSASAKWKNTDFIQFVITDKIEVRNSTFTASNDISTLGDVRDTTLLFSFANSRTNVYVCESGPYLVCSSSGFLVWFDKATGKIIEEPSSASGPIAKTQHGVVVIGTSTLYFFHYPTYPSDAVQTLTISGTANALHTGNTGRLYVVNTTGSATRYSLGLDSTETGTLPGMTNQACAYCTSPDENTLYVIDALPDAASAVTMHIFDISTFASPSLVGSVSLTASNNGERYSDIAIHDDMIAATITRGNSQISMSAVLIDISTPSAPTVKYSSPVSVTSFKSHIHDGIVYHPQSNAVSCYQLPGMISRRPRLELREKGNAIYSPNGVFDSSGNQVRMLESDIVRAAYNFYNPPPRIGDKIDYSFWAKAEAASAETSKLVTFDMPSLMTFAKGEVASIHVIISLTINGSNEGYIEAGYELAAVDGRKINSRTVQHDSITGGASGVTSIVTSFSLTSAYLLLTATGGFTADYDFDARIRVVGSVHHGVGDWC